MPVPRVSGEWRSSQTGGYGGYDWDDANQNETFDEGEQIEWWDSDSDGLSDQEEMMAYPSTDPGNPDTDYDGIADGVEANLMGGASGFNPTLWDTDSNGFSDLDEFYGCYSVNYNDLGNGYSYIDWDGDGIPNHEDEWPTDTNNGSDYYADDDQDGIVNGMDAYPDDATNGAENTTETDTDGDGIPDSSDSYPVDATNGYETDTDGDGVVDAYDPYPADFYNGSDQTYYTTDSDSDGIPDYLDTNPNDEYNGGNPLTGDFDGDGLSDEFDEYPEDFFNGDSDQDGILDSDEPSFGGVVGLADTDGDGLLDGEEAFSTLTALDGVDTDHDGLTDFEEIRGFGTDPRNARSVRNDMDDYYAVDLTDTDGDTIPDRVEALYGLNPRNPQDGQGDLDANQMTNADQYAAGWAIGPERTGLDTDGDGMSDIYEVLYGLNPRWYFDSVEDPDGDGLMNFEEAARCLNPLAEQSNQAFGFDFNRVFPTGPPDSRQELGDYDGDGMPDWWEHYYDLPVREGGVRNSDNDALSDLQEYQNGTNPLTSDTDGDGWGDDNEVAQGTDPTNASSHPTPPVVGPGDTISTGAPEITWDAGTTAMVPLVVGSHNQQPTVDMFVEKTTYNITTDPDESNPFFEQIGPVRVDLPTEAQWASTYSFEFGDEVEETEEVWVDDYEYVIVDWQEVTEDPIESGGELVPVYDSDGNQVFDADGQPVYEEVWSGSYYPQTTMVPVWDYVLIGGHYETHTSTSLGPMTIHYTDTHDVMTIQLKLVAPPESTAPLSLYELGVDVEARFLVRTCIQYMGADVDGDGHNDPYWGPPSAPVPYTVTLSGSATESPVLTLSPPSPSMKYLIDLDPTCDYAEYLRRRGMAGDENLNFTITSSDSTGSKHRRIGLNGVPVSDAPPAVDQDVKQNPTETYVDAFDQGLKHSEMDISVPIASSLLTLLARRDLNNETWSSDKGVVPSERPDRPFGAGWTTNLCARLLIRDYRFADLVDETGASQSFVLASDGHTWIPSLEDANLVKTRRNQLSLVGVPANCGGAVYTKSNGTICTYERTNVLQWEGVGSKKTPYNWLRLSIVEDRQGNQLAYHYPNDDTLIPSSIEAVGRPGQRIRIRQDDRGLITAICAPDGTITDYSYSTFTSCLEVPSPVFAGSATTVHLTLPGLQNCPPIYHLTSAQTAGAETLYDFAAWLEEDPTPAPGSVVPAPPGQHYHCVLESLTNPGGQTYAFEYQWNHSVRYWDVTYAKLPDTQSDRFPEGSFSGPGNRFRWPNPGDPKKLIYDPNPNSPARPMTTTEKKWVAGVPSISQFHEAFTFYTSDATDESLSDPVELAMMSMCSRGPGIRVFAPLSSAKCSTFFGLGGADALARVNSIAAFCTASSSGSGIGRSAITPIAGRPFFLAERWAQAGAVSTAMRSQQTAMGSPAAAAFNAHRQAMQQAFSASKTLSQTSFQANRGLAGQAFATAESLAQQASAWREQEATASGTPATRAGPFSNGAVTGPLSSQMTTGGTQLENMVRSGTSPGLWSTNSVNTHATPGIAYQLSSLIEATNATAEARETATSVASTASQSMQTGIQGQNSTLVQGAGALRNQISGWRNTEATWAGSMGTLSTNVGSQNNNFTDADDTVTLDGAQLSAYLAARSTLRLDGEHAKIRRQLDMPPLVTAVHLPDGSVARFSSTRDVRIDPAGLIGDSTVKTISSLAANPAPGAANQVSVDFSWDFSMPKTHMSVIDYPPKSATEVLSEKVVLSFEEFTLTSPAGEETYGFDFFADMALTSVTDLSGNTTLYEYSSESDQPTQVENALGEVTSFEYAPDSLERKNTTSPDGSVKHTELQVLTGLPLEETVKDKDGNLLSWVVFEYENDDYPAFVTRRIDKRVPSDPEWLEDRVTEYVADDWGRIAKTVVDPANLKITTYNGYDIMGRPIATFDPNGNVTRREYDAFGQCIKITFPDCGSGVTTITRTFDSLGNLLSETNENGVTTWNDYDELNRCIRTTIDLNLNGQKDARGQDSVVEMTYNSMNLPVDTTDQRGYTNRQEYDGIGRPSRSVAALGLPDEAVTTYEYGENSGGSLFDRSVFKPTVSVDPAGRVTTTVYDKLYRPLSVTKTDGGTTSTIYDVSGNASVVTDALGRQSQSIYDPLRRLVMTIAPDGASIAYQHTSTGLQYSVRDVMGGITTTVFDTAGRPIEIISPAVDDGRGNVVSPRVRQVIDNAGNIISSINALGFPTLTQYDARNRAVRVIGAPIYDPVTGAVSRPVTLTQYDALGNVVAVTDPLGATVSTTYDALNRPVEVRQPAIPIASDPSGALHQPIVSTTFDPLGNILTVTDPNGGVITNTYDAFNRQVTTTDGAGITVSFGYDAVGNRTTVTDGKGNVTTFTYDGLNRQLSEQPPSGAPIVFGYDELNKTSRTDQAGNVTLYGYDVMNRLKTVTYQATGATRTYEYDPAGRITLVVESGDATATVGYVYDVLGRIMRETSNGVTHSYQYDLAGNRLRTTFGGTGKVERRGYDALGRLSFIVDESRGVTRFLYDLAGRVVTRFLPNGHWVGLNYDAGGHVLISTTYADSTQQPNRLLLEQTWDYDLGGNVCRQTEQWHNVPGRTQDALRITTMGYDGAYRLTSEVVIDEGNPGNNISTAYAYDAANNRTSKTVVGGGEDGSWIYSYNDLNQLTGFTRTPDDGSGIVQNVSYTYDANGNRASRTSDGIVTDQYRWDLENRLAGVLKENQASWRYSYDYRTRRIGIDHGNGEPLAAGYTAILSSATVVVFSGGLSVAEYEGTSHAEARADASRPTVTYVRGPDLGGGVGGLVASLRIAPGATTMTPRYNVSNGRGDVVAQSDAAGQITWTASYEAFGKRPMETGTNADRQRANSKEEDPTGLLNEGFRYRDIETGTWLSRDPAGFVDGPNLYAYVKQNPWTAFDPEGLFLDTIWDAGNLIYDTGRVVKNVVEVAYEGAATGYHKATGDAAAANKHWSAFKQDAGELGEAGIDIGTDALAAVIPFVPAGGTKALRATDKVLEAADAARDVKKTADKVKDGTQTARKQADETAATKPTGSYTNTHESGKKYHGKGTEDRMNTSAKEKATEHGDPVVDQDFKPAANRREAFKDEARRIREDGGVENPNNYNKRNSPGEKYLRQDGE